METKYGECHCGCGEKTTIPRSTNTPLGRFKDIPMKYRRGHNGRFSPLEYVIDENGCWIWQRCEAWGGYGKTKHKGKTVLAHRVLYERVFGEIPHGLELDHLCRVRLCVNPEHLEAVTHAENMRRGLGGILKTHCKRDHEFTEENTYRNRGERVCRECKRMHDIARRQRLKILKDSVK